VKDYTTLPRHLTTAHKTTTFPFWEDCGGNRKAVEKGKREARGEEKNKGKERRGDTEGGGQNDHPNLKPGREKKEDWLNGKGKSGKT